MEIIIQNYNRNVGNTGDVLIDCPYDQLRNKIVPILLKLYRDYDLTGVKITIHYPEEPSNILIYDLPLFEICHKFMNDRSLAAKNLTLITGNFLAADRYRQWRESIGASIKTAIDLRVAYTHWDHWLDIPREEYYTTHHKPRFKKYVNLNGRAKPVRSELLNYMYTIDGLEDGLNSYWTDSRDKVLINEIKSMLPLRADHLTPNSHSIDQSHLYDTTCFSIVTESVFSDYEGGITEKTYKTFYYRSPFILVSSPGTIARLHELGFKTFGDSIDESYDQIIDNDERMAAVQAEIHKLCSMSLDELGEWHHSFSDIYDHNQDLLYQFGCTNRRDRPRRT